jgi:hypothetical protein
VIERPDRDLVQKPGAPQIVTQATHRMAARDLLAEVRGDDHRRLGHDSFGERRQQLHRRVVRPLEVVEEDGQGPAPRGRRDGAENGLQQDLGRGLGGGWSQLRQEHRQIRGEGAAILRQSGRAPETIA